uniref:Transcription factor domain-containing protein n=1 Tax=Bionectria ochroleuca TaxID=29856 RepID=A0A8H7TQC9_BIOOC
MAFNCPGPERGQEKSCDLFCRKLGGDGCDGAALFRQQHLVLKYLPWDVTLSDMLQERKGVGQHAHTLHIPHLPYLPPRLLSGGNALLLDFFNASRSRILSPIMDEALAQFVLRAALDNSSNSSNLILEGVLIIASLQLHGHSRSLDRRSRLISMLQKTLRHADRNSVLQNLVATMLLYQYELLTTTNPQIGWRVFLCGAKKIISALVHKGWLYQDDNIILMDWIYYHEVSAELSLRHWADADSVTGPCKAPQARRSQELVVDVSAVRSYTTCPMDALDLIWNVCKRPPIYSAADMERMQGLKRNLQKNIGETGPSYDISETPITRQHMMSYLYTCAALIYFNRAVANVSPSSFEQKRLVREGIFILHYLGPCESAWPLFILACEASNDEERLQMSDILSKTGQESLHRVNHVPLIRSMVEAVWNQNDLNADSAVSYVETLNAVFSTAPSLPLFA